MGGNGNNPSSVASPAPSTAPAAPKPTYAPGTAGASPAVANFFGQNTATGAPGQTLNTGYGFGGPQPPIVARPVWGQPMPVWGGNPPHKAVGVPPQPVGPAKPVAPIARPIFQAGK